MDNTKLDFRRINFGMADATQEGQEFPQLLVDGYLDPFGLVDYVLNSNVFLFLGYKGSGKSALSEHLRLALSETDKIVDQISLRNFAYKVFAKITGGKAEPDATHPLSWSWLLLVEILNNLREDPEAVSSRPLDVKNAMTLLERAGLLPITSISSLVSKSGDIKIKAELFKALSAEFGLSQSGANVSMSNAVEFLRNLIYSYTEMRPEIIIFDGLDDILSAREVQYEALASLVNVVKDMNLDFKRHNLPIKIVVLCRTELYELLPDPNRNKTMQDNSFSLIWYREGVNSQKDCDLVQIANKRTQLVFPSVSQMFPTFFQREFNGKEIEEALLDNTRHIPRDFLQLMRYIQKQCRGEKVSEHEIKQGINAYSTDYFVHEIEDELTGYISNADIKLTLGLLSSVRKPEFSLNDIRLIVDRSPEYQGLDLYKVFRILYNCSAIGQLYKDPDNPQITKVRFKYRSRNSNFSLNDRIILHRGLRKALLD